LSTHGVTVDLDMGQARAFVVTADERHFGRAAGRLFLSQQALSKRIARLADELGVKLFRRGQHVELSEAGHRFLEPARQALAAADSAVAAARAAAGPLRIDVWGHLYGPMRTLSALLDEPQGLTAEVGRSRDLPSVLSALRRGEADAGFGRVHAIRGGENAGFVHRIVRLEPLDALVSSRHPLGSSAEVSPGELRDSVLWAPAALSRLDFLARFAREFGITCEQASANLGLSHLLAEIRDDPRRFCLVPADLGLPDEPGVRFVPVMSPTPLYAWSLIWLAQQEHPMLATLLGLAAQAGRRRRWLDFDPATDWLPGHDRTQLRQQLAADRGVVAGDAVGDCP
jgi:DNA-binding transcriptional LysR family regulator